MVYDPSKDILIRMLGIQNVYLLINTKDCYEGRREEFSSFLQLISSDIIEK
jgi:hypothetical protein